MVIDFSLALASATDYSVYQLIFNCKYQLLRIELHQIVIEIWKYILVHGKNFQSFCVEFKNNINQEALSKFDFIVAWSSDLITILRSVNPNKRCFFTKLSDFDHIPQNKNGKSYHTRYGMDFVILSKIKSDHKKYFGVKNCNMPQCRHVQSHESCACKAHLGATPPCRWLSENGTCNVWTSVHAIDDGKSTQELKKKFQARILKHLCQYDHFELFNEKQPYCINGNKCDHYLNVLNGGGCDFNDKIHLHLYFHKPCLNDQMIMSDIDRDETNKKNDAVFEYVSCSNGRDVGWVSNFNYIFSKFETNYQLFLVIQEVIQNGFIKDLKPKSNNHNRVKNAIFVANPNVDDAISICSEEFGICDEIKEKTKHERYKHCPLHVSPVYVLALLLYCNGDCNANLCMTQIDGTYQQKWPYLDAFLNLAISTLGAQEVHYENLYSGLCHVRIDMKELYLNTDSVMMFKSNVSFSSDITVAKEFRGAEGMILGLNLSHDYKYHFDQRICACDVSWLSKYPTESEVLVARRSMFSISPSQAIQIGKNQYVLLQNGDDIENSFQKMFLM